MGKHDQIVVWMNGKKTTIKRSESNIPSQDDVARDEYAATVDRQLYEKKDTLNLPSIKKKKEKKHHTPKSASKRKWKPIIMAITSAVCIGVLFGMIMLKMVGTFGDYGTPQPTADGISGAANNRNDEMAGNENKGDGFYTVPRMEAFVLQGGVFEKEASVDDWKKSFQDATFSPVVWKGENQYHLFVGIAQSKEQGKAIAKDIKDTFGFDVFAKSWYTEEKKLDLSQEEKQWLDSVMALWDESLKGINESSEFPMDDWKDIQHKIHETGNQLRAFHKRLTQLISELDNPTGHDVGGFLLQVWHSIDSDL